MVTMTLDAMAAGGMYDHVGGGFHRYSIDDYWLVPHFEKMLYDQALLAGAYLRGYLLTGEPRYREVVEEIDRVRAARPAPRRRRVLLRGGRRLGGRRGQVLLLVAGGDRGGLRRRRRRGRCGYFGVTRNGNFVDPHTQYSGSILHQVDRTRRDPTTVRRALPALLAARELRVRPGLDDKVLTAWNALFTRSLVEAGRRVRPRPTGWTRPARNLRFLLDELRRDDGRLLRSWQADGGPTRRSRVRRGLRRAARGRCSTAAEHDDVSWLEDAVAGRRGACSSCSPTRRSGGFFTTGSDAEALIVRPQDFFDNATPSENSLAADALLRLAAVTR